MELSFSNDLSPCTVYFKIESNPLGFTCDKSNTNNVHQMVQFFFLFSLAPTMPDKLSWHFVPKKRKIPYYTFTKCLVFLPILIPGENP